MLFRSTLSEPRAATDKDNVTAESMPPDKPKTTPSELASFTLVLMKLFIMSKVSLEISTLYDKEGLN